MGPILDADVHLLQGLSRALAGHAGVMTGLAAPAPIAMRGSVLEASARATAAVTACYRDIADRVRQMSGLAQKTGADYEAIDQALRDQLRRYDAGLP